MPATEAEAPREPDDRSEIDLRRYLNVVLRRKWVVVACLAAGVTLAVLYTMRQTKIYEAVAQVEIDPTPPQVFGDSVKEAITLGTGNYWSTQQYYNTQVEIIESYDLIRTTVSHKGLYKRLVPPEAGLTDAQSIDRAAVMMSRRLNATQNRESQIVKIRVRLPDANLARDIANEHVQTYLEFTKKLRTTGSGEVADFLTTELDDAEKKLHASEVALYEFKDKAGLLSVSLEDKQNLLSSDISRYDGARADADIKLTELRAVRDKAMKLAGEDVLQSPVFALASNGGTVEALKEQYVNEKQKLTEAARVLGPKNPELQQHQQKVDELLAMIQREATRALREIDAKYQVAVDNERQLDGKLEALKNEALLLGPKAVDYNRLKRQYDSDEANVKLVRERLGQTQLSKKNEQINVRLHDTARGAGLVFPRMRLNVVLAFMLALAFGIGLAFVLEYADRTIKSTEDVTVAAQTPVLGLIPILDEVPAGDDQAALKARDLYVFSHPKSRAAECCRSIRTNLLFSGTDRELKVLTVASPNPREGKTTSCIYMGTTMAQSGQRVLLVDTDMRRPRLHKSMGVPRGLGLSNLMLGESSYEDCIKTSDIPNLFVLQCGPTPPNPAELLMSQKFQVVLDELRTRFDRILLDSPPLQAVTDAAVLAKRSDGVIVVVQAGKTLRDDLARSSKQLRDVNANVVGVILNDLDISDRQYGYYYYYHYGYGDDAKPEGGNKPAPEGSAT